MIIYIIIGIIFIVAMIVIFAYIYNGNGNGKGNKKFTFQYNQNKHYKKLHQNPIKLLPQKIISNEQENQYNHLQYLLNEQENKYNLFQSLLNEQEEQYIKFKTQFNEQEKQYTPPPKVPLAPKPLPSPSPIPPPKVPLAPSPSPIPPSEKLVETRVPISEKEQINESEKVKKCPYIAPYFINYYNNTAQYQNPSPYGISCASISQWTEEQQQEYSLNYPVSMRVPYAERDEIAWDPCRKRCTKFVCSAESENKPECPIITSETCNIYGDMPINSSCEQLSFVSVETQETPTFNGMQLTCLGPSGGPIPTVEKGQICWDSCNQKCVSPERPKEQSRLKTNINPLCKPTMDKCDTTRLIGNNWNQAVYEQGLPDGRRTVFYTGLKQETCQEWSQFTNWQEHGLAQNVLPGEICYNPCTGNCTAPRPT
jgi:hypothetical protein